MQITVTIDGEPRVFTDAKQPRCLTEQEWVALQKAEYPLYRSQPPTAPGLGYTDVMPREESQEVALMWDQAFINMDGACELDGLDANQRNARIAYRVARAQGVLVFGPEFLLR